MANRTHEASELRKIKIFLASPSDVRPERSAALRVVRRLEVQFRGRCVIESVHWEALAYEATSTFQQQIPPPSECQLAVFIFWTTLGTAPVKIKGNDYLSGTMYEFEDAMRGARESRLPILVYRKREKPTVNLDSASEEDIMKSFARLQEVKKFFDERFKDSEHGLLGYNSFETAGEFEESLERDLRGKIEELLMATPSGATDSSAQPSKKPFMGLKAFGADDQHLFFGRTRALFLVEQALRKQADLGHPFLVIFGRSGVGKSSFVRAGLVPRIISEGGEESHWCYALFEPSDSTAGFVNGLAAALVADEALPELAEAVGGADKVAQLLRQTPEALIPALRTCLRSSGGGNRRVLLVVDPLEEIFTRRIETLGEGSDAGAAERLAAEHDAFARALAALCRSGLVWVVATLRSDFYDHSSSIKDLRELKQGDGQFHLPPLSPTELAQCVRLPAELARVRFEETRDRGSLADEMINQALKHTEPLPLLSFSLEQVFERSDAIHSGMMTFKAFDELGGVAGAGNKRADEAYAAAAAKMPEGQIADARNFLFGLLVDVDRDGRRVRLYVRGDVITNPNAKILEQELDRARLILRDKDDRGESVFTIAHETMIREWLTLRTWIDEREEFLRLRNQLSGEAAQWKQKPGDRDLLLLQGGRLTRAEQFVSSSQGLDISPTIREYIAANINERDREQRNERRRRNLFVGSLGAALVVSLFFLFAAWVKTNEANFQREEANQQMLIAQQHAGSSRDFVNFLLDDLQQKLNPSDQRDKDLIDEIAKRVVNHYNKPTDTSNEKPEEIEKLTSHMADVAKVLSQMTRYGDAGSIMERGCEILRSHGKGNDAQFVVYLTNLGRYSFRAGDYKRTQSAYAEGLKLLEQLGSSDSPEAATVRGGLAGLYKVKGQYDQGAKELQEVCRILAAAGPKYEAQLAVNYDALADLLRNLNDLDKSEEASKKAIAIAEKQKDLKNLCAYRAEYAVLLQKKGKLPEAEKMLLDVIEAYKKQYGQDNDMASFQYKLGRILIEAKDLEKADVQLQTALRQLDTPTMARHLRLAKCLEALGMLQMARNKPTEATDYWRRCQNIREEAYDHKPHPDIADVLELLANAAEKQMDETAARNYRKDAAEIREKLASS